MTEDLWTSIATFVGSLDKDEWAVVVSAVAVAFAIPAWWASRRAANASVRSASASEKAVDDAIQARHLDRRLQVEVQANTLLSLTLEADAAREALISATAAAFGTGHSSAKIYRDNMEKHYASVTTWNSETLQLLEPGGLAELRRMSDEDLANRLAQLTGRAIHIRRKTNLWLKQADDWNRSSRK